ncbi:MAG: hypothetical protein V7745_01675 [Pseudomonadales bacterium]
MTQQQAHTRASPASSELAHFAASVAAHLKATETGWLYHPDNPAALLSLREDKQPVHLELTPFTAQPQPVDAAPFFRDITTMADLLQAYRAAKATCTPEPDSQVHPYASQYLEERLHSAHHSYSAADARRVAQWVSTLDCYAAVKSVESLLDCHSNLTLFELAEQKDWQVHFDHLAIRCGSAQHHHAETMIEALQHHHGYVQSHIRSQKYYQFDDGWNAYPLYKILNNGQVIRLFVDQSNANAPLQIIQHWNRSYGFNAHHLALRVTRVVDHQCQAVPLTEVIAALADANVDTLTPTGFYTHGLLEQVFQKPRRNTDVPTELNHELELIDDSLTRTIENGKLIELVSRRELPSHLAEQLFSLYHIKMPRKNKALSAPIYPYFLPAQAAHVILTSLETQSESSE